MKAFLSLWLVLLSHSLAAADADVHVWQKIELTFRSQGAYENPYRDVDVWVDLKGPGFEKRCYGFWDGSNKFSKCASWRCIRGIGPGASDRTNPTPA